MNKNYYKNYYQQNKEALTQYAKDYYLKKKNPVINNNRYKKGELVNLGKGRTGIVIRDYDKFIRVKITSGEHHYTECFFRQDIN